MMSATTLKTELLKLTPTLNESEAIQTLTNAYGVFAGAAESNSITISSTGVTLGKTAMSAALVGISVTPNAGFTKIPQSITAFWVAVAGGLATSFTGATAITPPPHATLPNDFMTLMLANTAAKVTKDQAAENLANLLYTQAIVGGTVTFPGPTTTPIT